MFWPNAEYRTAGGWWARVDHIHDDGTIRATHYPSPQQIAWVAHDSDGKVLFQMGLGRQLEPEAAALDPILRPREFRAEPNHNFVTAP